MYIYIMVCRPLLSGGCFAVRVGLRLACRTGGCKVTSFSASYQEKCGLRMGGDGR